MRDTTFLRVAASESNMDALHALAAEGAADGTALAADELTRGRGARGRSWHAPRGGLWLSVLRRPTGGTPTAGVLSLRVGLAMARVVERLTGLTIEVKWPNDLILAGRKVGGILCELRWQGSDLAWAVIGVGINVENSVPETVRPGATSLVEHRPGVALAEIRDAALAALRTVDVDRATLEAGELDAFGARDWLAGQRVVAPVAGVCHGVTADGALRLVASDGVPHLLRSSEGLRLASDVTPGAPST